jgi:hypothetical protein
MKKNPSGGEIFRTCPDRPWGPPSLLYNGYRVFPGGKERPGRDADPSLPSSTVGHERVELYLYFRYGPYGLYRASVPVQGWPLPLSVLPETFLILRRTEGTIVNVKYPLLLLDFNQPWIFPTYVRKILKHTISWKFLKLEQSCPMWTDGRTASNMEGSCEYTE